MQSLDGFCRTARYWALFMVLMGLAQATPAARADLIGFTTDANTGDLFRINFGTGTATRVGATGLGTNVSLGDLATSNDGTKVYGISQIGGSLYSINTSTGAATLVNGDIDSNQVYQGLDFAPNGQALVTNFDTQTTISQVNLTAPGGATAIQTNVNTGLVDAMAVDSATSILVVVRGASTELLQRINLINGAVTTIGDTGLPNNANPGVDGDISGIDFFNGSLYGISLQGNLYQFSLANGAATLIASQVAGAGRGFLGLTTNVVPEPSSLVLIATGLVGVGARRLHQRRRLTHAVDR